MSEPLLTMSAHLNIRLLEECLRKRAPFELKVILNEAGMNVGRPGQEHSELSDEVVKYSVDRESKPNGNALAGALIRDPASVRAKERLELRNDNRFDGARVRRIIDRLSHDRRLTAIADYEVVYFSISRADKDELGTFYKNSGENLALLLHNLQQPGTVKLKVLVSELGLRVGHLGRDHAHISDAVVRHAPGQSGSALAGFVIRDYALKEAPLRIELQPDPAREPAAVRLLMDSLARRPKLKLLSEYEVIYGEEKLGRFIPATVQPTGKVKTFAMGGPKAAPDAKKAQGCSP